MSALPRTRRRLNPYAFIAPFLLIFVLFNLVPNIYAIVLSFENNRGFGAVTSAGFSNYSKLLRYGVFWTEVSNTLFYWVVHAVPLIVIAFLLALIVRTPVMRLTEFWKTVIFLPQVMNIIAVSLVFQTLFSQQYGVVNSVLHLKVAWLTDPSYSRWVIVGLLVWQELGFWFVVFLAGLSAVDPALEEAALVDGASYWQRVRRIIIPLLKNVFLFAVVVDAMSSIALYSQPNVLTSNGGLAPTSIAPVLNLLVTNLQGNDFGASAAVGWLIFLLTVIVSGVIFAAFRLPPPWRWRLRIRSRRTVPVQVRTPDSVRPVKESAPPVKEQAR
jgi:ABC-type sugar transport system permease subunit